MQPELALKLVSILSAYFTLDEVVGLAAMFEVDFESLNPYTEQYGKSWLPFARELTQNLDKGNHSRLLDSMLDLADDRNSDGIAHTTWQRQAFHEDLVTTLREARELLSTSAAPSEIALRAGSVFSAKSKVRELLETASDEILIVDPYIGVGTLDCLRGVSVSIRLLTGNATQSIENGFDQALAAFQSEGHKLAVRRAASLHDRHVVLNDRCWLVGGSLKDAGKKAFNCIEIVDHKADVIAGLEKKWDSGTPFP